MLNGLGTYGAVAVKIRAMWGKRLTSDDYRRLLSMRSVPEIAAFLRAHPGWSGALDRINVATVHRAELEMALRRHNVEKYLKLFPYLPRRDHHLIRYPVLSVELEQIMRFMTLASIGRAQDYVFNMPQFFDRYSKIRYQELSAAVTYEDMLEAVREAEFYRALLRLKPENGGFPDYTTVETTMYSYYFRSVEKRIEENIRGRLREDMLTAIRMQADLRNIETIMRVKRYYPQHEAQLFSYLIPIRGNIRPDQLKAVYAAQDWDGIMRALSGTVYGRYFSKYEFEDIDQYYFAILYDFNTRNIAMGVPSVFIPMCYLFLQQVELSNLIHVIESVRYGLSPDNAARLLIGAAP